MSDLIPYDGSNLRPQVGQAKAGKKQRRRAKTRQRATQAEPLTDEQCLIMLSRLPGLVVSSIITTAQCNAIRQVLSTILAYNRQSDVSRSGSSALTDAMIMEVFAISPEALNAMVDVLTEAQVEMLRQATAGRKE